MHIPKRLRFECSGCGNCCLQWPVPATPDDVQRIESLLATEPGGSLASKIPLSAPLETELQALIGSAGPAGFRPLRAGDRRFHGFTHTLEKRSDGRCRFLTAENRCRLHEQYGATAKPAMCQLFPHSFSVTPSGIFAYVSFASSAVLFNSGRLLSEQPELLRERYMLYEKLFPESYADWSKLQLIDGVPLSWENFERIEAEMLAVFDDDDAKHTYKDVITKLLRCSSIIVDHLPADIDPESLPPLETPAHIIDRIILKHLSLTYLPEHVFDEQEFDLDARALMTEIVQAPPVVTDSKPSVTHLPDLGALTADIEDLLTRYAYARLFAKLYLGPNLAHLSLVAGLHHLTLVLCVARNRLKEAAAAGPVDLIHAAETVRTIERRLCQMNFSPQSSAIMEVLFSSPSRMKRVAQLVR